MALKIMFLVRLWLSEAPVGGCDAWKVVSSIKSWWQVQQHPDQTSPQLTDPVSANEARRYGREKVSRGDSVLEHFHVPIAPSTVKMCAIQSTDDVNHNQTNKKNNQFVTWWGMQFLEPVKQFFVVHAPMSSIDPSITSRRNHFLRCSKQLQGMQIVPTKIARLPISSIDGANIPR